MYQCFKHKACSLFVVLGVGLHTSPQRVEQRKSMAVQEDTRQSHWDSANQFVETRGAVQVCLGILALLHWQYKVGLVNLIYSTRGAEVGRYEQYELVAIFLGTLHLVVAFVWDSQWCA